MVVQMSSDLSLPEHFGQKNLGCPGFLPRNVIPHGDKNQRTDPEMIATWPSSVPMSSLSCFLYSPAGKRRGPASERRADHADAPNARQSLAGRALPGRAWGRGQRHEPGYDSNIWRCANAKRVEGLLCEAARGSKRRRWKCLGMTRRYSWSLRELRGVLGVRGQTGRRPEGRTSRTPVNRCRTREF
jgi:hypothetical protein